MSKKTSKKKSSIEKDEITSIEEDHERLQECIRKLRELLKDEKNLKIRTDDTFLLRFLRWVDFDTELAFAKVKQVYKFRADHRDWFPNKPPSEYKELMCRNIQAVLHDRDSRGRRIYIIKLGNVDTRYVSMYDFTQMDDLWMENVVMEEETQRNGVSVILDMSGYSLKLFAWLTPSNNRIGAGKLECFTMRNIDIHVVNTSMLLNASIAIVYPFLDAKFKERIHFHSNDWPSLHKHINPEALPEEYGGHLPSMDYDKLRNLVYDNEEQLIVFIDQDLHDYAEFELDILHAVKKAITHQVLPQASLEVK